MNKFSKLGTATAALFVGVVLGVLLAKDTIQTALFDRQEYLDCFETEVFSEYQTQNFLSGKSTSRSFVSILTPQVRSHGNQTADYVKKNGLKDMLQSAKERSGRINSKRIENWQAEGEIPEKDTFAIIAEAQEICLERQSLW